METKIVKTGRAGSLESNDLIVEIEPADDLIIEIKSVVEDIFKDQIENVVRQTLKDLNIDKAKI